MFIKNGSVNGAGSVGTDTTNFGGILSSTDTDVQKALDTLDDAAFTGALGVDDTTAGLLTVYGHATGSTQGGKIILHTPFDQSSIDSFIIDVFEDDLLIGPDTDTDSLKYDGGTGQWQFTGSGGVSFAAEVNTSFVPANNVTSNAWNVDINPTGTLTGGTTDHVGIYIDIDSDVNADGKAYYTEGISVDIDYTGVATIFGMDGALLTVTNGGSGTIDSAYGTEVWIDQAGSGEITTGYAYYAWINRGAGTFTTAYGIYIDIDGTIANKWGIYIDGDAKNYLTGNLNIGTGTQYLNFGGTDGTGGYGVRDNSGTMEFKDSGGSWITFASLVN